MYNTLRDRKTKLPDIPVDEVRHVLALIIMLGHDVRNTIKDYWLTSELHCTPFYSKVMKHDQFMNVMKVLHFKNNTKST